MKNSIYLFLLIPAVLLISCDTKKSDPNPKPEAAFHSDKTEIDVGETINFFDDSENNPSVWAWDFGDGSAFSTAQNPSHTYTVAGTYTVTLKIANANDDSDNLTKTNYITVNERLTGATFYNPTFTAIDITVQGITKTIAVGDSVTFDNLTGTSTTIDASTSGKTTDGIQIGELMEWNNTIDLNGGKTRHILDVGPDYFFLNIRNKGSHILTPLYVNYASAAYETLDEIEIPNDNVRYATGYYIAENDTRVLMQFKDDPNSVASWLQDVHFALPFENNQVAELSNTLKSNLSTSEPLNIMPGAHILNPAVENVKLNSAQNRNANHLLCKGVDK